MRDNGITENLYNDMLADIRKNKACIALKYLLEFHRVDQNAQQDKEDVVCDVIDYLGDVANGRK